MKATIYTECVDDIPDELIETVRTVEREVDSSGKVPTVTDEDTYVLLTGIVGVVSLPSAEGIRIWTKSNDTGGLTPNDGGGEHFMHGDEDVDYTAKLLASCGSDYYFTD